jgi:hypothetical protein
MTTQAQQLADLSDEVRNLRAFVHGMTPEGWLYALIGTHVVFGCKVTQGYSGTDMILALEGAASGDSTHLNPDAYSPAYRPEQYYNIANIYGRSFYSENKNVSTLEDAALTVGTAPGTGYHRYDIAYAYVGPAGPAVGIMAGTAVLNAATPTDPTLPLGATGLARVHVEANVTGIANAKITDIRNFSGRLGSHSDALDAAASAAAALAQAVIATAQAGIATTQAGTATTQAGISTAKAVLTAADAVATAADRVQTGVDKVAAAASAVSTAADRVQTGLDRTAASGSAASAAAAWTAALAANPDLNPSVRMNPSTIATDFTVASYYNAFSGGPLTIGEGVSVTLNDFSEWSII